jgi:hypothetical protein
LYISGSQPVLAVSSGESREVHTQGSPPPSAFSGSGQALRCAAVDEKHGSQAGDEGKDDEQVAGVCTGAPSPPDAPPHLLYRRAQRVAVADVPAGGQAGME